MSTHAYGPVPSRRFGLSLGVDVVPAKTCTLDCIYCQLGPTPAPLLERRAFVPPETVAADVAEALAGGPRPDVISLAGSGEPTLYSALGSLARQLRQGTGLPLVLITNGTLLWRDDVAADAALFDVVAPSLDAGSPDMFRTVNRPHPDLAAPGGFERFVDGLERFSQAWPGKVRLEVFLLDGVNDSPQALEAMARLVERIRPAAVDLNTAVRPTPGRTVQGVSQESLARAAAFFPCPAVPIAAFRRPAAGAPARAGGIEALILETLRRRPCTAADLAASLGLSEPAVLAALASLREAGCVRSEKRTAGTFHVAT